MSEHRKQVIEPRFEHPPAENHGKGRAKKLTRDESAEPDMRSVIRLEAGKYHEIAEAAENAIVAAGLPLFDRGGMLVTPVVAKGRGADRQGTKTVAPMEGTQPLGRGVLGRGAGVGGF